MRTLLAFFFYVTLVITAIAAHRDHLIVFRPRSGEECLEIEDVVVHGVTIWGRDNELKIIFKDGRSVLIHSKNHLHDVFINDHFRYTCAFRKPQSDGILMIIIKEDKTINIAESPNSFCQPSFDVKEEIVRPKKKPKRRDVSLRIPLLRSLAMQAPPLPQPLPYRQIQEQAQTKPKSVRFMI